MIIAVAHTNFSRYNLRALHTLPLPHPLSEPLPLVVFPAFSRSARRIVRNFPISVNYQDRDVNARGYLCFFDVRPVPWRDMP